MDSPPSLELTLYTKPSPSLELTLYTPPPENSNELENKPELENMEELKILSERLTENETFTKKHEEILQNMNPQERNQLSMILLRNRIETLKVEAAMIREKLKMEGNIKNPKGDIMDFDFLTLKKSSDEEIRAFLEKEEENMIASSSTHVLSPNSNKRQKSIMIEVAKPPSQVLPFKVGSGKGAFKPYNGSSSNPNRATTTNVWNEARRNQDKGKQVQLEAETPKNVEKHLGGVNMMNNVGLDMPPSATREIRERSAMAKELEDQWHARLLRPTSTPRIYWSPELHEKFVAAVNDLGGLEVATPRELKGLMMVPGLKCSQIKSHLQVEFESLFLWNYVSLATCRTQFSIIASHVCGNFVF